MEKKESYGGHHIYNWHLGAVCICVCVQSLSHVWLFVAPWTLACQACPCTFSRQEYWCGLLHFQLQRIFLIQGSNLHLLRPLRWYAGSLPLAPPGKSHLDATITILLLLCPTSQKSKRIPEKHLFLLYWLCQSLWLCGSQETVENSERDGNTRPPDLSLRKPICRSGNKS